MKKLLVSMLLCCVLLFACVSAQADAIPIKTGQTHECTNLLAAVKNAGGTAHQLDFSEDDSWTYAEVLPDHVTPELYNIEYRSVEQITATASPGNDWVQGEIVSTSYQPSGEVYESNLPLDTSETRKQTGWYYYHWCGSDSANCAHSPTGTYFHFDSISSDTSVIEVSSHADVLDARYTSYVLKWPNGSYAYCKSGTTCDDAYGDHGNRSYYWYKMYSYQDYTAEHTYVFSRETGWTATVPDSYTQVRYSPKGTLISSLTTTDEAVLLLSQTLTLTPVIVPEDATMLDLVWASSNEDIAMVENGLVIPMAPGRVAITCTSVANPLAYAECLLTIRADKQLILPDGLTLIRAEAFYGANAQEIVLPESVIAIGRKAFANCEELMFIRMPDSLVAIANDAFAGSDNVIFICSPNGYAAQYAADHGIEIIEK